MPEKKQIASTDPLGKKLLSWEFWEKDKGKKTTGFYTLIFVIFLGLMVVCIFTKNFLFLIFLILFLVILISEWNRPAQQKEASIYEDGIMVAQKFYRFDQIETFWIIYEPQGSKKLFLNPKGVLNLEFSVSLEKQDPIKLREILKERVKEDLERKEDSVFERLKQWLKI